MYNTRVAGYCSSLVVSPVCTLDPFPDSVFCGVPTSTELMVGTSFPCAGHEATAPYRALAGDIEMIQQQRETHRPHPSSSHLGDRHPYHCGRGLWLGDSR